MTADPPPTPRTTIYVRLDADGEGRVLSFRIPPGIDPLALLDLGFAIDGNQAACSVCQADGGAFRGPLGEGPALAIALHANQRALVDWLHEQGIEVGFA